MAKVKKDLTERGNFIKTTDEYLNDCSGVLRALDKFDKKHGGGCISTQVELIKNSIVGHYLGFEETNKEKQGYDNKMSDESKQVFLEDKQISFNRSGEPAAVFNDWTVEKNKAYEKDNVWVAAAIWEHHRKPLCIVFGKTNEGLSDHLEKETVKRYNTIRKNPNRVLRNSPSVTVSDLVRKFHFKVLSIEYNDPEKLVEKLATQHMGKITVDDVVTLDEFNTQRDIVEKSEEALF